MAQEHVQVLVAHGATNRCSEMASLEGFCFHFFQLGLRKSPIAIDQRWSSSQARPAIAAIAKIPPTTPPAIAPMFEESCVCKGN